MGLQHPDSSYRSIDRFIDGTDTRTYLRFLWPFRNNRCLKNLLALTGILMFRPFGNSARVFKFQTTKDGNDVTPRLEMSNFSIVARFGFW